MGTAAYLGELLHIQILGGTAFLICHISNCVTTFILP